MKYHYHERFSEHWFDIIKMVEENYAQDYNDSDHLVLSNNTLSEGINIPKEHKKIAYQLEPLVENHWWKVEDIVKYLKQYDEVWDYDLDNIKKLEEYGISAKYKPFIYSENLKRVDNKTEPDIEVLFYGTLTDYRSNLIKDYIRNLLPHNARFVQLSNVTGSLLDDFISRSKIILDLSSFDGDIEEKIQKQSRIYYGLINDKCIISEKSKRNYFKDLIVEVDIDPENLKELADLIRNYLTYDLWRNFSNVSEKFRSISSPYRSNNIKMSVNDTLDYFNINGWDKYGGTDKCTNHSYGEIYDEVLSSFRDKKGDILEIGVYNGASMVLWNEYLKNFNVFGVDCDDQITDNHKYYFEQYPEKITIDFKNAYDQEYIDIAKSRCPDGYDIIIDDGPHTLESQVSFIKLYSNLLKDDGVMIIEDIQDIDFVSTLIEQISEDYEYYLYDNREVKGRYDDIVLTIKRKV